MKKYINIIYILLILALPLYSQHNQVNDALDKVVRKFEESNGVNANFYIKSETNGYASVINGTIYIKDRMFYFVTEEMECGYDGTNLWSFIRNNNEINLSIPDEEEIININPYLLLKNYRDRFKEGKNLFKTGRNCSKLMQVLRIVMSLLF